MPVEQRCRLSIDGCGPVVVHAQHNSFPNSEVASRPRSDAGTEVSVGLEVVADHLIECVDRRVGPGEQYRVESGFGRADPSGGCAVEHCGAVGCDVHSTVAPVCRDRFGYMAVA